MTAPRVAPRSDPPPPLPPCKLNETHPGLVGVDSLAGTLDLLGLHGVPVGVGSDGGCLAHNEMHPNFEASACSYMPTQYSESAATLEPGRRLLYRLYRDAPPRSITLLVTASLKDPALFLRDNEARGGALHCAVYPVVRPRSPPRRHCGGFLRRAETRALDPPLLSTPRSFVGFVSARDRRAPRCLRLARRPDATTARSLGGVGRRASARPACEEEEEEEEEQEEPETQPPSRPSRLPNRDGRRR